MKILGIVFLAIGIPLCFTLIFTPIGFGFCGVGALLIIASAVVRRQKAQEELAQEVRESRRYARPAEISSESARGGGISNSAFGR